MAATVRHRKLHQVLAQRKTVQSTAYRELTDLYQNMKKPDLFNGFNKTFAKKDDDDLDRAPERKPVMLNANKMLQDWERIATQWFDLAATHEWANGEARADVVVDGQTILEQVPVTYLMFLDKQLDELENTISKAATLDPTQKWELNANSGLYQAAERYTYATKKVPRAHVLYEATDRHPAQVQPWQEDVPAGTWTHVDISGALPGDKKREILERVRTLLLAVRAAREEANSIDAPDKKVGDKIFGYLFS